MKCKKCGAEYGEDVKFCTQCGAPMGDEGQDSQAGTEPAMDAQADGEAEAGMVSAEAQAPEEGQPEAAEVPCLFNQFRRLRLVIRRISKHVLAF